MNDQPFLKTQTFPVDLPVYQGPLDLLLQLIEREELDITKVALAQVTDQYLAYVREMEQHDLANIADFVIIAARLLLIKSEALLPRPPQRAPGEEDPGEELARQLILYKKYKEIGEILRHREDEGLRTFLRTAAPPKADPKLDLSNLTALDLQIHPVDRGEHGFWLFPGEGPASSPGSGSRFTVRLFIACARPGGEHFDQLPGFDSKIGHRTLLLKQVSRKTSLD